MVVDGLPISTVFREEHGLMSRDRLREIAIDKSCPRHACLIETCDVVPVTRKALAAQTLLQTKNVDRRRFFPERSFRTHDAGKRCWEIDLLNPFGGIAYNIAKAVGLASRTGAEFKHDFRSDVAGA